MMRVKKEMKCEKKREKEELATYRVRTKACGMRDALRRLSEGFRDRLKRFDSTHDTGKYVRVYMCATYSFSLFFSLLFFSHTQTKTKETSCLRFENNHFLSLSRLFFSFTFLHFLLV
jgi:hypothetical protein